MITVKEGKELASLDHFNLKSISFKWIVQIIKEIRLLKDVTYLNKNFILPFKNLTILSKIEKPVMTKKWKNQCSNLTIYKMKLEILKRIKLDFFRVENIVKTMKRKVLICHRQLRIDLKPVRVRFRMYRLE